MEKLFEGVFKDRRVFVTGDTGFKGSWLAIWLHELGAQVSGYALPPKTNRDNFVTSDLKSRIDHQDGDIVDFDCFLESVKRARPEIVFHLAAQPLVLQSYKDPRETYQTNLMGTVNFFEIVRQVKSIKVAVNITSDKCYENQNWIWGYRENDPMGGKDPYSSSKGCSELITSSYINSFFQSEDSPTVASARAGNVIGGGDWAEDRIVPDFFRAYINQKALSIRNPYSTRPWQHVLEPLSGYLHLASALWVYGKKYSGGWNFGPMDSNHYTVEELINRTIACFGSGKFVAVERGDKLYEANLLKLDISKSSKLLSWKPILDFGKTIEYTVDGYKADLENQIVYTHRVNQIKKYIELANKQEIKWTK